MATWNLQGTNHHVLICNGSSCMRKGGEEITLAIRDEIQKKRLDGKIHTTRTRCNGRCQDACVVISYPEGFWCKVETPEMGRSLVRELSQNEIPVKDNLIYHFTDNGMTPSIYGELTIGKSKETN